MKTRRWNITEQTFARWHEENPDVERLVLTGDLRIDNVQRRIGRVDYHGFKEIVFENFVFHEDDDYTLIKYLENYDNPIPAFIKMIANRDVCNSFVVEGDYVYSADHTILVHVPETATSLSIRNGVERIGAYACYCCSKILDLSFPEGLRVIGTRAFCQADGFTKCILPATVTTLGEYAFCCADIEHIVLSGGISEIPCGCFELCWLQELNIPNSVKTIESHAFHGNLDLVEIVIPEGVESIGYNVFDGCQKISLPSTLKDIAPDFYYEDPIDDDTVYPYITISKDNPTFFSDNGMLYFRKTGDVAIGRNMMIEMIDNKTYHW